MTNCSDFVLFLPNRTHLSLVVTCLALLEQTALLVSTEAQIDFRDPQWEVRKTKIWAKETETSWVTLAEDVLLRGVGALSNSYVEVWSWLGAKELVGLLDRTFLGL